MSGLVVDRLDCCGFAGGLLDDERSDRVSARITWFLLPVGLFELPGNLVDMNWALSGAIMRKGLFENQLNTLYQERAIATFLAVSADVR